MCVTDIDEAWEVFSSWWGIGKCIDCGWHGRVLYEEMGPEMHEEEHPLVEHLILNDGVPDWRDADALLDGYGRYADDPWDEFLANHYEVFCQLEAEVEDVQATCECCLEARRWLSEWCHSWLYGRYLDDIAEHWDDGELERTITFGRLVWHVKNRWRDRHGHRLEPAEAGLLVQRSLDRLRADLSEVAA